MPERAGLTPAVATVAVAPGTNIGTAVPANHRRYIYSIKTFNAFAGANDLVLTRTGPIDVDTLSHLAGGDMVMIPDDLREDSLPIYILDPADQLLGVASAGNCFVRILFVDVQD